MVVQKSNLGEGHYFQKVNEDHALVSHEKIGLLLIMIMM